jgi:hypothetical protein
MSTLNTISLFVAVIALTCGVQTANADTLTPMDSSAFAWKYEMDVDPATQNLDSLPGFDWTLGAGKAAPAFANGIMTVSGPTEGFYTSGVSGGFTGVWDNIVAANGFTYEARLRTSNATSGLSLIAGSGLAGTGLIQISSTGIYWTYLNPAGSGAPYKIGGTYDNSTDFHNYRIAQSPSGKFYVWRDGELVGNELGVVFGQTWNYAQFAAQPAGFESNTGEFDYVRIQTGAYAPVPEPTTLALLVTGAIGLLAYAWRKRK